jgi:putative colanic acid biosynthesis UDP-glucose lipid carrier transferase
MRSFALRSMDNARRSVDLDIEYISRWSLGLDLRIMVKTLVAAMSGPDVF